MAKNTTQPPNKQVTIQKKPSQNPKTTKDDDISFVLVRSKGGRPRGSILDKISTQRAMLQHIVITGDYETCYQEYCTRKTYVKWVKSNQEYWEGLVRDALKQHNTLKKLLYNPAAKGVILNKIHERIREGNASVGEMMRFYEMLPETPL